MAIILEPVERLDRDIKRAAATLGRDEARFLTDQYYALQDFRIQSGCVATVLLQVLRGPVDDTGDCPGIARSHGRWTRFNCHGNVPSLDCKRWPAKNFQLRLSALRLHLEVARCDRSPAMT